MGVKFILGGGAMNKKVMSFVLAMVLSVGLGCSSLFANSYSDYASEFNSYYSGKIAAGSVKVKVGSPSDLLGGNLTAVFGYYAGTLISYQGAGGQFQLYDSYGARFSVDNKGGAWNVNGFTARASDLAEIEAAGSAEAFLESVGFSPESLRVAALEKGEDGTYNLIDKNTNRPIKQVRSLSEYSDGDEFNSEKFMKELNNASEETEYKFKSIKKGTDGKVVGVVCTYTDKDGNEQEATFTASSLNTTFMANLKTAKISSAWFNKLKDTLKSGVNFSASIQVGSGITGPSLTVLQNGKAMVSYITDTTDAGGLRPTTLYVYDDNGFQIGIQQATFEIGNTANGVASGKWEFNYTAITYDSTGVRMDTTYQFFNWQMDPSGFIATYGSDTESIIAHEGTEIDENTQVAIISQTTYSGNNTALCAIDYTTNNTTYYANNMPSYVVNAQGTTVELYKYTANGVIQAHFNAVGTSDEDGNKVGTTTVYDQWGRQLFTATDGSLETVSSIFSDDATRASMISEYYEGIRNGKFTVAEFEEVEDKSTDAEYDTKWTAKKGTGTKISNICIYADQILDTSNSNIMTNGFIDMKKVNGYLTSETAVASILKPGLQISGFGYTTSDIFNMLNFANGTNTALAQTTIAMSSWDESNVPAGADDQSGKHKSSTFTAEKEVETVSESRGSHKYHQIVDSSSRTEVKKARGVANGISYTNTILIGGAQAYSTVHNVVTERIDVFREKEIQTDVMETDPAVEGTLVTTEGMTEEEIVALAEKMGVDINDAEALAKFKEEAANGYFTDSNGDIYAMVKDFKINMMDGNGFVEAKTDEVMLVKLNGTNGSEKMTTEELNAVKAKITEALNAAGADKGKIMFMGNASYQEGTGNLAVTIDVSFGGGVVTGNEIETVAAEIDTLSKKVADAKTSYESGNMSKAEFDSIVKDAGWVGTNTLENLGDDKFGSNGFTWDQNKTAQENLRDAWKLLLNF